MEEIHIIEDTLDKSYKIIYFLQSKRFFKVNDNAIGLIQDILHGEKNCSLSQKHKLKDEKVEEYKKRINEYTQPLHYETPLYNFLKNKITHKALSHV